MAEESQTSYGGTDEAIIMAGAGSGIGYKAGQRLTISGRFVTKLGFWLLQSTYGVGGLATFTIRKLTGDYPGTLIASKAWGSANMISTTAWQYCEVTFDSPVYVNEEVRILCEVTSGTQTYHILVAGRTTDVKGGEYWCYEWHDFASWIDQSANDIAYVYTYEGGADAEEAVVTTQAVSALAQTTATGNGTVVSMGVPAATEHGHVWKTKAAYQSSGTLTIADTKVVANEAIAVGAFTTSMTGFILGTQYVCASYITDFFGTCYGTVVEFTTLSLTSPTITTGACTSVTANDAVGNGNIASAGDYTLSERGHVWKLQSLGHNPTILDSIASEASGATGDYTRAITPLTVNTAYYVRAYVKTSGGLYFYGNEVELVTSGGLPIVTTNLVTDIATNTAVGNLTLVNNGGSLITQYGVVYGTSSVPVNPGNVLPSASGYDSYTEEGADALMGDKTSDISGLSSAVTYYVRAYATNTTGTKYGDEVSFITKIAGTPTVTTEPMTNIEATSAYGHGTIVDIGASAVTEHGHVWGTSSHPTTANPGKTAHGAGSVGVFISYLTSLINGTTYYVRAYATNTQGTGYGDNVTFTAGKVAVYPTNPVTRVTSIVHYFNRGNYSMKIGLGDVIADIGIPSLGGTSRRPIATVPSLTVSEEAMRMEEIARLSAELQRILAAASVTGGILSSYARSVLIQRAIEIKAQIDALYRM